MSEQLPASSLQLRFLLRRQNFCLDVDFTAPGQGITALFGPSGSGKTTLLRCIAGLEQPEKAYLKVNQECWHDQQQCWPTHCRAIGYVFQESHLFSHLSVRDNLDYGLRRIAPAQRTVEFEEVSNWLALEPLLQRRPEQLSGGQRQRVAIARALLTSPKLLLMDEPLASLDPEGKAEILKVLENLYQRLEIPVLYVSHAAEEVQRLADHLVLMEQGRVIGAGEINSLLTNPDLPIAHLEAAAAVLEAHVIAQDKEFHLTQLAFRGGEVSVAYKPLPIGQKVRLRICARDVSLALEPPQASSISNYFKVRVISVTKDKDESQMLVCCDIGGQRMLSRVTRKSVLGLAIEPNKVLYAQVKSVALL